jgi:TRAP-type uncharacterized transport system substrate-binding protein
MRCVAYRVRVFVLSLVSIVVMALPGAVDLPAAAQTPAQPPKAERAAKAQPKGKSRRAKRVAAAPAQPASADPLDENEIRQKLNNATIGLAAGQLEGAPLRFATELARVLDDGPNMRVVPMVTRGIFDNLHDLLYLRGVDAAIVYGDTLDHFRNNTKLGASLDQRISYIMPLFPSEVHVFVRPEITRLEDLAGKPVNFNTKGTAAAYSGPIIFDRLGIDVDPRFDPHPVAMAEMAKSDRYAAVVFVSSKPLDPFVKQKWPEGFKFLPVPLTPKIEEFYIPAQLEAADYPGLIPNGQKVQTIAVPSVLAVINFPREHERYKRMVRLVDYLFDRFSKLQTEAGYHPKWKELNLAGTVPGWTRFAPMQAKLNATSPVRAVSDNRAELRGHLERMLPGDPGSQQQLLRDLLDQRRSPSKR